MSALQVVYVHQVQTHDEISQISSYAACSWYAQSTLYQAVLRPGGQWAAFYHPWPSALVQTYQPMQCLNYPVADITAITYVLSGAVLCCAVVFCLWAWLPDSVLEALGVTYYPSK